MFFHQDDIILLWDLITNFPKSLLGNASGHLIVFFRPIYLLEWYLFRLNFNFYLAVSIVLHFLTIYTAGKIVYHLTQKKYWQTITMLALVVNANFYEVLWMPSSQMMSISTLFSLLATSLALKLFRQKSPTLQNLLLLFILSIIPGLSWGTGLPIPAYLILAFGWLSKNKKIKLTKIIWPLLLSQLALLVVYILSARSSSSEPSTISNTFNIIEIIKFVFFGISYSIVGRYLFPFASRIFRFLAVGTVSVLLFNLKTLNTIKKFATQNTRFLVLCFLTLFGSYFLIALGRWQFGLGQAGAPRYAYLPMMFLVIFLATSLSKLKLNRNKKINLLLVVMIYSLLSLGAFTQVTAKWTERPQKNKVLFQYIQNMKPGECLQNDYIPWYIVETDKWTLKDIWPIFEKNFDPFTGDTNCTKINRDKPIPWSPVLPTPTLSQPTRL